MAVPPSFRMRAKALCIGLAILLLLSVGVFWPWLRVDDNGFLLTPGRPLWRSNREFDASIWRSRGNRLLIRAEGMLGDSYYVAEAGSRSVRGVFSEEVTVIGPWAIVAPDADYYPSGQLPEMSEMRFVDDLLVISTPDGTVHIPCGKIPGKQATDSAEVK